MKVAIIGATGYGGIELIRLLEQHPYFSIASLHSFSQVGECITNVYPHLRNVLVHTLQEIDVKTIGKEAEIVFLATPAGVSAELTPKLVAEGLKVIDLSGDFLTHSLPLLKDICRHHIHKYYCFCMKTAH